MVTFEGKLRSMVTPYELVVADRDPFEDDGGTGDLSYCLSDLNGKRVRITIEELV